MIEGPRDRKLIDTLEVLDAQTFEGIVWRVTRDGRDPTLFFGGGNRWDDGTFDVLYTSLDKEGALAEMKFHVSRGQPITPTKIKFRLHELKVRVDGLLDLTAASLLANLGVDRTTFGKLPYLDRHGEYETCQKIAETAHFLGSDDPDDPSGILVPNARHKGNNLVIFGDYVSPEDIVHTEDHGVIDWSTV
uniref:RES family NAD+ phosphorylase n=1 Tax=Pararhizobium sp. IMCC3301 TaxID=3067904 RepID=UPI002741A37C|nr:RES family NAD+ phosphorylase [Pararhizobium sp. IMCC3301]